MYGPDQSKNCGSSPSSWSYLSPRRSYSGQQPIWVAHRQANATLPGSKAAALPGFKLWVHRSRPIGGQPAISGSVDRRKQRYHTLMPAATLGWAAGAQRRRESGRATPMAVVALGDSCAFFSVIYLSTKRVLEWEISHPNPT